MDSVELLWLLLPVAAASGWWFSARRPRGKAPHSADALRSDYVRGINYLLNEQPDQAIEAFVELLEVDRDTVETHLALGGLYRRRGEVDRAIRIHQNLLARADLPPAQRNEALLELAQDYQSAGLLDRAEDLFRELSANSAHEVQALRQLIDIYEQEKDWENAISTARELERATGNQLGGVVAHYHCAQAEKLRQDGEGDAALRAARDALLAHVNCVRASLLEGAILAGRGDHRGALAAYRRVEHQEPAYIQETIEPIRSAFEALGEGDQLADYLRGIVDRHGGAVATLALADLELRTGGPTGASRFLAAELRKHVSLRGIDRLLELELALEKSSRAGDEHLVTLKHLTETLLEERHAYQCGHCGFPARALHWKCPSCKHWNSMTPLQGPEAR